MIAEVQSIAHELLADVAPELPAPYVMGRPRVSPECLGWAIPRFMSPAYRDEIDAWNGLRDIIVLDLAQIRAETPVGKFAETLEQVILHEAGHLLPYFAETPVTNEGDHVHQKLALATIGRSLTKPAPERGTWRDPHNAAFCRRMVHLWIRARFAGHEIPLAGLFGPSGVLDETATRDALASEAILMRHATFAEIEAVGPPAEFLNLKTLVQETA